MLTTSVQKGFSKVEILIIIVATVLVGLIGWRLIAGQHGTNEQKNATRQDPTVASWSFNGTTWKASGTPPACPSPLAMASPVDTSKVTGILYPGQYRGGNYKTHGGFRFDNNTNDSVTVTIPMDGKLYKGSRYIEAGETQYLLFFINPCGIMYRFDHLATLSDVYQKIVDENFPPAQENNSATTNLVKDFEAKTGDIVATGIGFKKTGNTTFDFGVYDLRALNKISENSQWASAHQSEKEFAYVGTCWFDDLPATDATRVKNLPAVDAVSGAISDYCATTAGTTLTNTIANPSASTATQSAQSSSTAGGGSGSGSGSGTSSNGY